MYNYRKWKERGESSQFVFNLLVTVRKCPQPPALSEGVGAVTWRVVGGAGPQSLDSWDVRLPFLPATEAE